MKKPLLIILTIATLLYMPIFSCLNTISNNTSITFKIAEVKKENGDLKQMVYLPEEYEKDEEKAHTLAPNEEIAFGGHYVPTYIIYKEYPDKKWHPLLIVKQMRCGPRGPENKYLLITDLLKQQLPDDYQPVYKFTLKVDPSELDFISNNEAELSKIANPYQELYNIIDDMTQKILELFSRLLRRNGGSASNAPMPTSALEQKAEDHSKHGAVCESCVKPATETKK